MKKWFFVLDFHHIKKTAKMYLKDHNLTVFHYMVQFTKIPIYYD